MFCCGNAGAVMRMVLRNVGIVVLHHSILVLTLCFPLGLELFFVFIFPFIVVVCASYVILALVDRVE